jgi:hypothetical protein
MTIKASGRSALILATGLLVCFAGPSQAAPSATATAKSETAAGTSAESKKYIRQGSRHLKKYAQRKSSKTALKSSTGKKTTDVADDSDRSTAIPPSIANANAQLASAEAPPDSARAMSAKANTILLAAADKVSDPQVVAADQLNDVDRALQEGKPQAMAAAEAPASPSPATSAVPVLASSNENSTWDQTSLIGKIFIAFGALLTMASAARMFMA